MTSRALILKAQPAKTNRGHVAYTKTNKTSGKISQVKAKQKSPEDLLAEKLKRRGPGRGGHVTLERNELAFVLNNTRFALVSAGPNPKDPADKDLTHEEVAARHKKLGEQLKAAGFMYTHVQGHYGGAEDSYLVVVHDADRSSVRKLGEEFHQDSVIYADTGRFELHYTTGKQKNKIHVGQGWKEVPEADDYYTVVRHPDGSHTKFSLDIDFDTTQDYVRKAMERALRNRPDAEPLFKSAGWIAGQLEAGKPVTHAASGVSAHPPTKASGYAHTVSQHGKVVGHHDTAQQAGAHAHKLTMAPKVAKAIEHHAPGAIAVSPQPKVVQADDVGGDSPAAVAKKPAVTKALAEKALRQASLMSPAARAPHVSSRNDYGSDEDDTAEDTAAPKAAGTPTPSQSAGTVAAKKPMVAKAVPGWVADHQPKKLPPKTGPTPGWVSHNKREARLNVYEPRKPGSPGTVVKGGEGSHGGHVIGHTKSGKPIYGPTELHTAAVGNVSAVARAVGGGQYPERHSDPVKRAAYKTADKDAQKHATAHVKAHKDFTLDDHLDAAKLHYEKMMSGLNGGNPHEGGAHLRINFAHQDAARKLHKKATADKKPDVEKAMTAVNPTSAAPKPPSYLPGIHSPASPMRPKKGLKPRVQRVAKGDAAMVAAPVYQQVSSMQNTSRVNRGSEVDAPAKPAAAPKPAVAPAARKPMLARPQSTLGPRH